MSDEVKQNSGVIEPLNGTETEVSQDAPPETENKRFQTAVREFFSTKRIAYMAVFVGLSLVLYIPGIRFSIPVIFPGWLEFQFSDVPALIGGFMLGPIAGCIIVLAKCLIAMTFTITGCVGEFADILIGTTFVLTASLIYKKFKSHKGAVLGLGVGAVAAALVAVFANWAFLVPFFLKIFGWGMILGEDGVGGLYFGVTEQTFYTYYLPLGVVPFNLIRGAIAALFGYFLYQGLKKADKRLFSESVKKKV